MKSLTPVEAQVIQILLTPALEGEATRIRDSDLPRSTYHAARRRVLESGWVSERYIPSAEAVGATNVRMELTRPYAENRSELIASLREEPRTALVWTLPGSILSVRFEGDGETPQQSGDGRGRGSGSPAKHPSAWSVTVPPDATHIPVYFDFEAEWARLIGSGHSMSYPQSLPVPLTSSPVPPPRVIRAVMNVLERSGEPDIPGVPPQPGFFQRAERRAIEQRWVVRRGFPIFSKLPPYDGRRVRAVVFVIGSLRPDGGLGRLLHDLAIECGVTPFLGVSDEKKCLLGMLAANPPREARRPGMVLEILKRHLETIETVRESLEPFVPDLEHHYSGLIEDEPTSS